MFSAAFRTPSSIGSSPIIPLFPEGERLLRLGLFSRQGFLHRPMDAKEVIAVVVQESAAGSVGRTWLGLSPIPFLQREYPLQCQSIGPHQRGTPPYIGNLNTHGSLQFV